jgi:hypothetical protein
MIDVKQSKTFILTAPMLVGDVDTTIVGSQIWTNDSPELINLVSMSDGSAELTPVGALRGVASVGYTGRAIDASSVEVPTFGSETYNIIDDDVVVITPEPVAVTIVSTEKV